MRQENIKKMRYTEELIFSAMIFPLHCSVKKRKAAEDEFRTRNKGLYFNMMIMEGTCTS